MLVPRLRHPASPPLLSSALAGALALGLALATPACDAPGGGGAADSDASGDAPSAGDGAGLAVEGPFHAVLIRDDPDFACSVNQRSHGADIDAVSLLDAEGKYVSWWAKARMVPGDSSKCAEPLANRFTIASEAQGGANATLDDHYVALAGGYVIGQFKDAQEITSGQSVHVYEVGVAAGGRDDPYSVWLATDLSCTPDAEPPCAALVEPHAVGESVIALSGF